MASPGSYLPKLLATGGLLLVGTGLSVFGEAVLRKGTPGALVSDWFWLGTLSLVLINAGICLVVEAAKKSDR